MTTRQRPDPDGRSLTALLRHLDRIFGEINVALLAIAIGLFILDWACLLCLEMSAGLAQSR